MDTLGHAALAASWSPTSNQEIVYVTQENGITNLWSTTPHQRTNTAPDRNATDFVAGTTP